MGGVCVCVAAHRQTKTRQPPPPPLVCTQAPVNEYRMGIQCPTGDQSGHTCMVTSLCKNNNNNKDLRNESSLLTERT